MSRTYAEVIGDPIVHSKSPVIHNFWLGKLGIDAEYRKTHVRADELPGFLAGRRDDPDWRGCNVTIPHKESVARLVDVDERAAAVGAVNTVWRDGRLRGTNTDVDGVAEAVSTVSLTGRHVLIIGAGGAARAAFAFLARQGCAGVRVLARNETRALAAAKDCGLGAEFHPFTGGTGAFDDVSLVVNATQLGMTGQDPMPGFVLAGLGSMAPDGRVFDMVYSPLQTGLLQVAARLGLATSDGLTMLVGQAATAFSCFFGQSPPREFDAELRGLLTS